MGVLHQLSVLQLSALQTHAWSGRRGSNSRHSVWKTEALPTELHPRIHLNNHNAIRLILLFQHQVNLGNLLLNTLVEGEGFEPSYSERTDLQSVAFNHSATPPNRTRDYAENLTGCQMYKRVYVREFGAGCRNRTDDLRITSALLYQLS